MKLALAVLLLGSAASLSAASPDGSSASGLWKIAGDVYGHPVDMMCQLTQTAQKLSGTCSTASDGFVAHKVDGSVKGQKFQLHFQSSFGGNSIMMIVNGKANEDLSHVSGDLDVEPIGVGGKFEGVRAADQAAGIGALSAGSTAGTGAVTPPDGAPATAPSDVTGVWNIEASFGRTAIQLACELLQKQQTVGGTCTADDAVPRAVKGEVTAQGLIWRFQTPYQGQLVDISVAANVTDDPDRMTGSISVAPVGVVALFTGARQSRPQGSTASTIPAR